MCYRFAVPKLIHLKSVSKCDTKMLDLLTFTAFFLGGSEWNWVA